MSKKLSLYRNNKMVGCGRLHYRKLVDLDIIDAIEKSYLDNPYEESIKNIIKKIEKGIVDQKDSKIDTITDACFNTWNWRFWH